MAEPGFEIEIHVAGGQVVRFELEPDYVRRHRHATVVHAVAENGRSGLWTSAVDVLRYIFDRAKDKAGPIEVVDENGDFWIISPAAVSAVRVRDLAGEGMRTIGFVTRE
jgi:hypothetical protein